MKPLKTLGIFSILLLLLLGQALHAQNWLGHYITSSLIGAWQPTSLYVPGNGTMKLPVANNPFPSPWFTEFENNILLCTGPQMVVEARVMNPASGGGIDPYDFTLTVLGNCGTTSIRLVGTLAAQGTTQAGRTHTNFGTTMVVNHPNFVQNLSTYGILRIEVNLTNIVYRWNGAVMYTLSTPNGGIGQTIQRISLRFRGSGSVDYVRVYNWASALIYDEEFDNTTFAPASPCTLPLAACNATLPVEITSFTATAQTGGFVLDWETAAASGITGYEVQSSTDQAQFETVGFVPSTDAQNAYSWVDRSAVASQYYRIAGVDLDGNRFFSKVLLAKRGTDFEIGNCWYANASVCIPVIDGTVERIELLDLQGRLLHQVTSTENNSGLITIPVQLDGGGYFVRVHSALGDLAARRLWVLK
jgi:hypothetical protein